MTTPEGPLHRVAIVSLVDREPDPVADCCYRDEKDAIDVLATSSPRFAKRRRRQPPPPDGVSQGQPAVGSLA